MQPQTNSREILHAVLSELQVHDPEYTVPAFARDLGMDYSNLIKVLKGQRKVTPKLALVVYVKFPKVAQLSDSLIQSMVHK